MAVVSHSASGMVLRVSLPGYLRGETEDAGGRWLRIALPACPLRQTPGEPMLPFILIPVRLPSAGSLSVEATPLSTRSCTDSLPVAPAPPMTRRAAGTAPPAASARGPAYAENALFPPEPAVVGAPHTMGRDREAVLYISPIRLNPVSNILEVCWEMELRLAWTPDTSPSAAGTTRQSTAEGPLELSRSALDLARGHEAPNGMLHPTPGTMLVICADAFYDAMLPFVYWKRQKGIPTHMVTLSEAGGNNPTNVYNFVKAYSVTNTLTFLQLVGDAGLMPALPGTKGWMVGKLCDYRYALIAGDDMYPDINVARFPAQNLAEVSNMVQRSVNYEAAPSAHAAWYKHGLGAASSDSAGGLYDYERTAMIRSNLLSFTYAQVDHFYGTNISAALISSGFNQGLSIANFIGHGDSVSWSWYARLGSPHFNVGNVRGLLNTNMLPFAIVVGCQAGRYTVTNDCLAEAFLKAGTGANPVGAIGVFAAFDEELAVPPCTAQAESVERLVDGTCNQLGPLCTAGVVKMLDVHQEPSPPGTAGEETAEQRHLFGDGSLMIYTDTPAPMSVSHAGTMPDWQGYFPVHVAGVTNALCALYDPQRHELLASAGTDPAGNSLIPLPARPQGDLLLTVTAFNHLPYTAPVRVATDQRLPGLILHVR